MNGHVPEADDNVVKVDTIAHAQTWMVHKQLPQESEHLTTMHTQNILQHVSMLYDKSRNNDKGKRNSCYCQNTPCTD